MSTPEEFVPDEQPDGEESPVGDELSLFSDGDGLAVIGPADAVERFLMAEGMVSTALDLQRLAPSGALLGAGLQTGAMLAANAGRWVKMTERSSALRPWAPIVQAARFRVRVRLGLHMRQRIIIKSRRIALPRRLPSASRRC